MDTSHTGTSYEQFTPHSGVMYAMSKAFTRDPDDPQPRCQGMNGCGTVGESVGEATLRAQLPEEIVRSFGSDVYFCPNSTCSIAYFDGTGTRVPVSAMIKPAWPKDVAAPLCPCFGVTRDEMIEDACSGHRDRIREIVKKVDAGEGRCTTLTPSGKSCVTELRRIFMAHYKAVS